VALLTRQRHPHRGRCALRPVTLGGRPKDPSFYDQDGHVLYWKVAKSGAFLRGLERLEDLVCEGDVAMMCRQEDPTDCHRRLLVGRVLRQRGIPMRNIRGDGEVQEEVELAEIYGTGQPQLFAEMEVARWRFMRSVSAGRLPKSCSAS
jgi:uncharacterized protein (DUF488 family)